MTSHVEESAQIHIVTMISTASELIITVGQSLDAYIEIKFHLKPMKIIYTKDQWDWNMSYVQRGVVVHAPHIGGSHLPGIGNSAWRAYYGGLTLVITHNGVLYSITGLAGGGSFCSGGSSDITSSQ